MNSSVFSYYQPNANGDIQVMTGPVPGHSEAPLYSQSAAPEPTDQVVVDLSESESDETSVSTISTSSSHSSDHHHRRRHHSSSSKTDKKSKKQKKRDEKERKREEKAIRKGKCPKCKRKLPRCLPCRIFCKLICIVFVLISLICMFFVGASAFFIQMPVIQQAALQLEDMADAVDRCFGSYVVDFTPYQPRLSGPSALTNRKSVTDYYMTPQQAELVETLIEAHQNGYIDSITLVDAPSSAKARLSQKGIPVYRETGSFDDALWNLEGESNICIVVPRTAMNSSKRRANMIPVNSEIVKLTWEHLYPAKFETLVDMINELRQLKDAKFTRKFFSDTMERL